MRTRGAVRVAVAALVTVVGAFGLHPTGAAAATVPSAPRSVATVPGAGSVKVTWQAPAATGGAKIDVYKVVWWAPDVPKQSFTVGKRKRAFNVVALTPGTTYSFKVAAHNARGWSKASAAATGVPNALAGFGAMTGACGLAAPQLDAPTPSLITDRSLDFGTDRYDDPADKPQLTPGGQEIINNGNLGGSSLYSEVFAFETLARCEGASLIKTETEIAYDVEGKKTDLLVGIDGEKVGVSVVRAFTPMPSCTTPSPTLPDVLESKLDDIVESSQNVSPADAWVKQILVVVACDGAHADAIETAWAGLDAPTKADTIVSVVVTDGDDLFIYVSD